MRNLFLVLAVLATLPAHAETTQVSCNACRDVYEHPRDFGNFAYNLTFGDSPVLTLAQANMIKVWNPAGQWAMVDLNFVMLNNEISIQLGPVMIGLPAPDDLIQIRVQDPAGTLTTYEVFNSSSDLLVGDGSVATDTSDAVITEETPELTATGSGGSGGFNWSPGYEGPYYWYFERPDLYRSDTYE